MNRVTFPAMGTTVAAIGDRVYELAAFFAAAESVFSRFDPESELTALNASADREFEVTDELAACLHVASELRETTGGLVDPAVGAAVIDWGYDRTFGAVTDLAAVPEVSGTEEWSIAYRTVRRRPGTRLDLGGIAKGWTADRAVELGLATLVSAGGDVRNAGEPWPIALADPWGNIAATVLLGRGGLATSSTTRRRWHVSDSDAHHVIDPRWSRPATSPVLSATVAAATAVQAEAGAKAVLLHGARGLVWAEQQDWIDAALVVWHDGSVYASSGWTLAA